MPTVSTNYSSVTDTTAITITLASLASSSTLVAGRQSTVIDNTTNKYDAVRVMGQVRTGTTVTAGSLVCYVFGEVKAATSTFSFPVAGASALGTTDAAATFDAEQKASLKLGQSIANNTTNSRDYNFDFEVSQLFGGVMPEKWGLWFTHSSVAALDATAGNHWFHYTGYKYDVV